MKHSKFSLKLDKKSFWCFQNEKSPIFNLREGRGLESTYEHKLGGYLVYMYVMFFLKQKKINYKSQMCRVTQVMQSYVQNFGRIAGLLLWGKHYGTSFTSAILQSHLKFLCLFWFCNVQGILRGDLPDSLLFWHTGCSRKYVFFKNCHYLTTL